MLDKNKVQSFIKQGKSLGKTREELKIAYDRALGDGIFNIPSDSTPDYNKLELEAGFEAGKARERNIDIPTLQKLGEDKKRMESHFIETEKEQIANKPGKLDYLGEQLSDVGTKVGQIAKAPFIGGKEFIQRAAGDVGEFVTGARAESAVQTPGIMKKTKTAFTEVGEDIKQAKIREVAGKQTGFTSLLQGMGFIGGGVSQVIGDAFMGGAEALAPKELEEDLKIGIQKLSETKGAEIAKVEIQKALDGYKELQRTDPTKAANYKSFFGALEATLDLVGFAGLKKVATKTGKDVLTPDTPKIVKDTTITPIDSKIPKIDEYAQYRKPTDTPTILTSKIEAIDPTIPKVSSTEQATNFISKGIEDFKKTYKGVEERIGKGGEEFRGVVGQEPVITKIKAPKKPEIINGVDIAKSDDLIRRGLKPSIAGKTTEAAYKRTNDSLREGIEFVSKSKGKVDDGIDAMKKTAERKKEIYQTIKNSNELVKTNTPITNIESRLDDFFNSKVGETFRATHPGIENKMIATVDNWKGIYGKNIPQDKMQLLKQEFNKTLAKSDFAKILQGSDAKALGDAKFAQILGNILDDNVMSVLGRTNKALNREYGSVRNLEKALARRMGVFARNTKGGLGAIADVFNMGDIVMGAATGDIKQLGKGLVQKATLGLIKSKESPNRIIKELFDLHGYKKPTIGQKIQKISGKVDTEFTGKPKVKTIDFKAPKKTIKLPKQKQEFKGKTVKLGEKKDIKTPTKPVVKAPVKKPKKEVAKVNDKKTIKTPSKKMVKKNKVTVAKDGTLEMKKAIDNKAGFINPEAILKDIAKLGSKIKTPAQVKQVINNIVKGLGLVGEQAKIASKVIKDFLKQWGKEIGKKAKELLEVIAVKTGAKMEFLASPSKDRQLLAESMEISGKNQDEIWDKLGLERGGDGKWKYEIIDNDSKIKDVVKNYNKDYDTKISNIKNKYGLKGYEFDALYKDIPTGIDRFEILGKKQLIDELKQKGITDLRGEMLDKNGNIKGKYTTKIYQYGQKIEKGVKEEIKNIRTGKFTLEEILNHPEFYKEFPDAKNMKVNFRDDLDGYNAAYNSATNEIDINISELSDDSLHSSLLHEIQHSIQHKEGFAVGGNIQDMIMIGDQIIGDTFKKGIKVAKSLDKKLVDDFWLAKGNINRFYEGSEGYNKALKEFDNFIKNNPDIKEYHLLDKEHDRMQKIIMSKTSFEQYQALVGEVEARNISNRLKMDIRGRKRPGKTETTKLTGTRDKTFPIERDEQLVRYDDKKTSMREENYRGVHKAPTNDGYNAPGHDLTEMYGDDIYGPHAARYFGDGDKIVDTENARVIKSMKGNPDKEVIMYRAVPNKKSITKINKGDWVTLSKTYANGHGGSQFDDSYKILEKKVKAKDIFSEGNSMNEFGYDPQ